LASLPRPGLSPSRSTRGSHWLLSLTVRLATPLNLNTKPTNTLSPVDVLQYALTLEHLEATFYREGLAKFSSADFAAAGIPAGAYARLTQVAGDEKTHVDFLTTALGSAATKECAYAFPMSSIAEFLGVASILEGVGVSAYLGAARQIANKDYLTVAGSILTVEARHSAYLRPTSSGEKLSPFPSAQDIPLTPNAVYTLASAFIKSCPSTNPALPVKAYPAIAATAAGPVVAGSTVAIKSASTVLVGADNAKLYAAFITAGGPVFADLTQAGDGINFSVKVPATGVEGQSYLVLCNCAERVDDATIVAGPAALEVTAA
jgi:rubrerythrin